MKKPTLEEVKNASHEQLARWWRFLPSRHFQIGDPVAELISQRLYKEFGGITPEISKKIGWTP